MERPEAETGGPAIHLVRCLAFTMQSRGDQPFPESGEPKGHTRRKILANLDQGRSARTADAVSRIWQAARGPIRLRQKQEGS